MVIPCEECLKLAICKTKRRIVCDDLNSFFNDLLHETKSAGADNCNKIRYLLHKIDYEKTLGPSRAWVIVWRQIKEIFPNVKEITIE